MTHTAMTVLQVLALAAGAAAVLPSADSRAARRLACLLTGMIAVWAAAALAASTLEAEPFSWRTPLPAMVAIVSFVAVSVSSLANTTPGTYGAMLALGALSSCAVWCGGPASLGALMAAQALVVGLELASRDRAMLASFLRFQALSLLCLAGSLVLGGNFPLAAAAVALRQGVWPFHSWFLRFTARTPLGLVTAFAAPQAATLLLLNSGSAPAGAAFAALAMFSALWAAVLASVQTDLKRVLGYLLAGQGALVGFGLAGADPVGRTGGLGLWLLVALATTAFAMVCEALSARHVDALSLHRPGGDFESTPILATSFLLSGMALVGLPGSLGFVAEDLLVQGTLSEYPGLAVGMVVVTAINAYSVMRCVLSLFVGPRGNGPRTDLFPRERLALSVLLVSLLLLGCVPSVFVGWFGA